MEKDLIQNGLDAVVKEKGTGRKLLSVTRGAKSIQGKPCYTVRFVVYDESVMGWAKAKASEFDSLVQKHEVDAIIQLVDKTKGK